MTTVENKENMMTVNTSYLETTVAQDTMAHLKDRVKDFMDVTELFDSRGFDMRDRYSAGMLEAVIMDDSDTLKEVLNEAFMEIQDAVTETTWFVASTPERILAKSDLVD